MASASTPMVCAAGPKERHRPGLSPPLILDHGNGFLADADRDSIVRFWYNKFQARRGTVSPIEVSPDEKVPLWVDRETGMIRIVGSRLKLQSVIAVLHEGYKRATDVVAIYDTLSLDQAQQIIDWYHTRRAEVDEYMEWSEQQAIAVMDEIAPYVDGNTRSRKGLPYRLPKTQPA